MLKPKEKEGSSEICSKRTASQVLFIQHPHFTFRLTLPLKNNLTKITMCCGSTELYNSYKTHIQLFFLPVLLQEKQGKGETSMLFATCCFIGLRLMSLVAQSLVDYICNLIRTQIAVVLNICIVHCILVITGRNSGKYGSEQLNVSCNTWQYCVSQFCMLPLKSHASP